MIAFPTLETARLRLRLFEPDDAPAVQQLLNDPEVTGTLMDKTLPYSLDDARVMIAASHDGFARGTAYVFAVVRKLNNDLVGYGDIEVRPDHRRGEIAYWIGRPYWWQGYATEAAKCLVQFGFETLGLNRIYAYVLKRNQASAHVLQKAGLVYEGTQRQGALKDGVFEDVDYYGLLRQDYLD
jgi:ribosomal-protein-alanine N-acetyltransferase